MIRITPGAVSKPLESLKVKTGDWGAEYPVIEEEKCIGCGECEIFCPDLCIELIEAGMEKKGEKEKIIRVAKVNYEYCKGCGTCSVVCPAEAIKMELKDIYRGELK